jgi:hypothetical protein
MGGNSTSRSKKMVLKVAKQMLGASGSAFPGLHPGKMVCKTPSSK